jgi:cytochrome c553
MKRVILACLLAGAAMLNALGAPSSGTKALVPKDAPAAVVTLKPGDPLVGRLKSDDERCQECHGHDGHASDIQDGVGNIGKFPKLAGQSFDYIIKQIRNFRSGERNHETMAIMAKGILDTDLVDVAAYFASQRTMQGDGGGDNPVGKALFRGGDAARGILACITCHGEDGKGMLASDTLKPVIGGQHRRYLQKQLTEWRAGARTNSPGGIMNTVTKALTDAEIDALSDYLSGL